MELALFGKPYRSPSRRNSYGKTQSLEPAPGVQKRDWFSNWIVGRYLTTWQEEIGHAEMDAADRFTRDASIPARSRFRAQALT
jgi:hypothetical protein